MHEPGVAIPELAPAARAVGPLEATTGRTRGAERQPPCPAPSRRPTLGSWRTPLSHRLAEKAIALTAMAAIAAVLLIFAFVLREALPLAWEELGEELHLAELVQARQWRGYDAAVHVWQPVGTPPKMNILPLLIGTLKITFLAMLFSVPLGLGCAVYTSFYAGRRVREIAKPAIELLAGIPSVVLGFFALMLLASWLQDAFGFTMRLNAVVASVGLSLAIVPIIYTIGEDAILAVPRSLSEAAMALGARRYQIALRVVIPAALPGIAAGIILGFGRAIGETMIVLMASGNAALMEPLDLTTSVRTITATIAAELGEVAQGDAHWRVLFLLGALLFASTFVLNLIGRFAVDRLHRKLSAA